MGAIYKIVILISHIINRRIYFDGHRLNNNIHIKIQFIFILRESPLC